MKVVGSHAMDCFRVPAWFSTIFWSRVNPETLGGKWFNHFDCCAYLFEALSILIFSPSFFFPPGKTVVFLYDRRVFAAIFVRQPTHPGIFFGDFKLIETTRDPPTRLIFRTNCALRCGDWNLQMRQNPWVFKSITPSKFKIAPEKWWLEDYYPFRMVYFQGLC